MSDEKDDLNLLLHWVPDSPPASPSAQSSGYLSDHRSPSRMPKADMSAFKDVVGDYLEEIPKKSNQTLKTNKPKKSDDVHVERFSGLRIRNRSLSNEELSNHFSETRFIRLGAIGNSLVGDSITGCWATVGVLTDKGNPKVSSNGKNFCIWKLGCLDDNVIPVFMFGDAYTKNWKEQVGTVVALFNAGVRKNAEGKGFALSVFSSDQVLKMGTSMDYGVCKSKKKDGDACTMIIDKRRGVYCKYHTSAASQKYTVMRAELRGGNLRTGFRDPYQKEGIYMVDRQSVKNSLQPVKIMSVDGLKKALSRAGKVTTNNHSQGIRFLTEVTGKTQKVPIKASTTMLNQQKGSSEKRLSSSMKLASMMTIKNQPETKRKKTEQNTKKMIELDFVSSDDDH